MKQMNSCAAMVVLCLTFSVGCAVGNPTLPSTETPESAQGKSSLDDIVIDASRISYDVESPGDWVNSEDGEFHLTYATFDGARVQLISKKGQSLLQIKVTGNPFESADDRLVFMMQEVARLSTGEVVVLGKTGYSFQMVGCPTWAYYRTSEKIGVVEKVVFGNSSKVDGSMIRVAGETEPVANCCVYSLENS